MSIPTPQLPRLLTPLFCSKAIPFAQAQFSLGYLSVRLAVEQASKHGKGVYYHRESCQTASSHFVQSAEIMPKDCTEYAIVLFYALAL